MFLAMMIQKEKCPEAFAVPENDFISNDTIPGNQGTELSTAAQHGIQCTGSSFSILSMYN